jgi:hypothetical protein
MACTRRMVYDASDPQLSSCFSRYFCDKFCQPKFKPDVARVMRRMDQVLDLPTIIVRNFGPVD